MIWQIRANTETIPMMRVLTMRSKKDLVMMGWCGKQKTERFSAYNPTGYGRLNVPPIVAKKPLNKTIMAKTSTWAKYTALRQTIASAIEDVWDNDNENPYDYLLAISPDLDEVEALLDGETEDVWRFLRDHQDWNIESATNYEDAINVADLYFDLR